MAGLKESSVGDADDRKDWLSRGERAVLRALALWGLGSGIAFPLIYAVASNFTKPLFVSISSALPTWANAVLATASFSAVAFVVGFLFGIPRSHAAADPKPNFPSDDDGRRQAYSLGINNNLEQISDWLTKIFVGVGLTQLMQIPAHVRALVDFIRPGLNDDSTFSTAVLLNGLAYGFMGGYLLTRLILSILFRSADERSTADPRVREVKENEFLAAARSAEIARGALTADSPPEVRKNIMETLTYNYLYAPGSYRKAIDAAREYVAKYPKESGRVWANLALAYGQQYREAQERNDATVLPGIRESALEAVRKALELEPGLRSLIRSVWDPKDPAKADPSENDLEPFFDDPEFKAHLA